MNVRKIYDINNSSHSEPLSATLQVLFLPPPLPPLLSSPLFILLNGLSIILLVILIFQPVNNFMGIPKNHSQIL